MVMISRGSYIVAVSIFKVIICGFFFFKKINFYLDCIRRWAQCNVMRRTIRYSINPDPFSGCRARMRNNRFFPCVNGLNFGGMRPINISIDILA
jgi:hypothetical protein